MTSVLSEWIPAALDDPLLFDEDDSLDDSFTMHLDFVKVFDDGKFADLVKDRVAEQTDQTAVEVPDPNPGEILEGSEIKERYPQHPHFILSAPGQDPLGFNAEYKGRLGTYFDGQLDEDAHYKHSSTKIPEILDIVRKEGERPPCFWRPVPESSPTGDTKKSAKKASVNHQNWGSMKFMYIHPSSTKGFNQYLNSTFRQVLANEKKKRANLEVAASNSAVSSRRRGAASKKRAPGPPRGKRQHSEDNEMEAFVSHYVDLFDSGPYQDYLHEMEAQIGRMSVEDWAADFYTKFRDNPCDKDFGDLNKNRKIILDEILYPIVNKWNEYKGDEYDAFEEAIAKVFKQKRLERILMYCLPMDRAQALVKMRLPNEADVCGLHWYCKLHLDDQYAHLFPGEQEQWKQRLENYEGRATMNMRLFQILYSEKLGLQRNRMFAKWSRPHFHSGFP